MEGNRFIGILQYEKKPIMLTKECRTYQAAMDATSELIHIHGTTDVTAYVTQIHYSICG